MMIPSLFSQFVPRVSSMDETFCMRCCSVCFGAETLRAATGDGVEIRAAALDGTVAPCCGGVAGAGDTEAVGCAPAGSAGCGGGCCGNTGFLSAGGVLSAGTSGFGSSGDNRAARFCGSVGAVQAGRGRRQNTR